MANVRISLLLTTCCILLGPGQGSTLELRLEQEESGLYWLEARALGLKERMDHLETKLKKSSDSIQLLHEALIDVTGTGLRTSSKFFQSTTYFIFFSNQSLFVLGTGCQPGFFRCGWEHPQCVYNFIVCDGVVECYNGADEEPAMCGESVKTDKGSFSS